MLVHGNLQFGEDLEWILNDVVLQSFGEWLKNGMVCEEDFLSLLLMEKGWLIVKILCLVTLVSLSINVLVVVVAMYCYLYLI